MILKQIDKNSHIINPSNISIIYEFLLKHTDILDIDSVLKFFKRYKSCLFERIRIIHIKAREQCENNELDDSSDFDENIEFRKIELNKNKEYQITANHKNMLISWTQ